MATTTDSPLNFLRQHPVRAIDMVLQIAQVGPNASDSINQTYPFFKKNLKLLLCSMIPTEINIHDLTKEPTSFHISWLLVFGNRKINI